MINRYIDFIIRDEEYGDYAVRAEEVEYDDIHVSLYEFENTPESKRGGRTLLFALYRNGPEEILS